VGNADHRRRYVDIEAADRARIAIGVVDDDDLAPAGIPADSPQQLTVCPDHGDHLAAIGTDHDSTCFTADRLAADVAGAIAEAIEIVAADIFLPARVADDDAVRLGVDGAAALDDLLPLVAEVGDGRTDHGAGHHACTDSKGCQVTPRRWWRWR